jgi:hypothetical protein
MNYAKQPYFYYLTSGTSCQSQADIQQYYNLIIYTHYAQASPRGVAWVVMQFMLEYFH